MKIQGIMKIKYVICIVSFEIEPTLIKWIYEQED